MTVRVLADSINIANDRRLTTLEVTIHRFVLAEFNTHRVFSRNSASSRAIPVEKMLQRVRENPAMPVHWGMNQSGMQAENELVDTSTVEHVWLQARDAAIEHVEWLLDLGLHKQLANRLLEPWMWQTIIVTSTEWSNFFALRCHKDAQPEIRVAAEAMRQAMEDSEPEPINVHGWHLPLIYPEDREELSTMDLLKVSAGRCARVSYLTHDGRRDLQADIDLHDRLVSSGHMSPLEHQASAAFLPVESGNLIGWMQYRKRIANESDFAQAQRVAGGV
jgi:thymidylate synthase ThyX